MFLLPHIGIFVCVVAMEIGWITAVRFVNSNGIMAVFLMAILMQTISYCNTLILVENPITMIAGVIGAGLGAVVGMKLPKSWFKVKNVTS
jgi:hypothetical protein